MSGDITVRRARASDRTAMIEITRDVWEGHDYVPLVWDRWLRDADGVTFVAELDGRVLGLQHAAVQPDNSAWLEGIRVASGVQGQGIGFAMLQEGIAWARLSGLSAVRLATSSSNPSSNRIAEKGGLEVVQRFATRRSDPAQEAVDAVRVALPSDLDAIWPLVEDQRFYTESWTAFPLTRDRLRLLLAAHEVAVLGDGAISAVGIATSTTIPVLRIGLLAGEMEGTVQIARWLRDRAAQARFTAVRAMVPFDSPALAAVESAGFAASSENWEHAMVLHALLLGGAGSADGRRSP